MRHSQFRASRMCSFYSSTAVNDTLLLTTTTSKGMVATIVGVKMAVTERTLATSDVFISVADGSGIVAGQRGCNVKDSQLEVCMLVFFGDASMIYCFACRIHLSRCVGFRTSRLSQFTRRSARPHLAFVFTDSPNFATCIHRSPGSLFCANGSSSNAGNMIRRPLVLCTAEVIML